MARRARRYAVRRQTGAPTRVSVGMKFNSSYADGNPQWEVISKVGRGAWLCRCVDDADYGGTEKAFLSREILTAANWNAMFDNLHAKHESWWASREIGETLHYDSGFGQWVRGVVVEHEGEKKLCPTALVGKWRAHDLPRRQADGSIYLGYHAQNIQDQAAWRGNESCMYEANPGKYPEDPRKMAPIDLSVPEMDDEAEAQAKLEQARKRIYELTNDLRTDPREALQAVIQVAQEALA